MDYCHRKLTLLASKAIREGVTTRDQHNLTGKAVVSSIEVQESQIYAAFVGFIVQTVAEEAFIHLKIHQSHHSFLLVKELQMQSAALEFEISLKAVSVLRYITDHTDRYGSVA